jgi:hypothetical protein
MNLNNIWIKGSAEFRSYLNTLNKNKNIEFNCAGSVEHFAYNLDLTKYENTFTFTYVNNHTVIPDKDSLIDFNEFNSNKYSLYPIKEYFEDQLYIMPIHKTYSII